MATLSSPGAAQVLRPAASRLAEDRPSDRAKGRPQAPAASGLHGAGPSLPSRAALAAVDVSQAEGSGGPAPAKPGCLGAVQGAVQAPPRAYGALVRGIFGTSPAVAVETMSAVTAFTVYMVYLGLKPDQAAAALEIDNTALATMYNLTVPVLANFIERSMGPLDAKLAQLAAKAPEASAGFRPIARPGLLTENAVAELAQRWTGGVVQRANTALRPPSRALGRLLGRDETTLAAHAGFAALWAGFAARSSWDTNLPPAVNAIPQFFSNVFTSYEMLRVKEQLEYAKHQDADVRALAGVVGQELAPALATRSSTKYVGHGLVQRLANDLRNVTGTPLWGFLNLGVAAGTGLASIHYGLSSDKVAKFNTSLATVQEVEILALKNALAEAREKKRKLIHDLGLDGELSAAKQWQGWGAGSGFVQGSARGLDRFAAGLSSLFGSDEFSVFGFASAVVLAGSYPLFKDPATWGTVANGLPQLFTTSMIGLCNYDQRQIALYDHILAAYEARCAAAVQPSAEMAV